MILDALLKFADAKESTNSEGGASYIDTITEGEAYVGCFVVARVDTAYTAGAGGPHIIFKLITSDSVTTNHSSAITLCQSATYVAAQLTAGKYWVARIPPGVKRYLHGYKYSSDSGNGRRFSAGKWDMFIVKDIDLANQHRYLLASA